MIKPLLCVVASLCHTVASLAWLGFLPVSKACTGFVLPNKCSLFVDVIQANPCEVRSCKKVDIIGRIICLSINKAVYHIVFFSVFDGGQASTQCNTCSSCIALNDKVRFPKEAISAKEGEFIV